MGLIRDIVEWKYERASWQWDVLCLVIMAFIFLTPKTWFEKRERVATKTTRLIVKASDFPADRTIMENKVKELSENPNAEIVDFREKKDSDGQTIYEIDIK
jgi:hypothetical protein